MKTRAHTPTAGNSDEALDSLLAKTSPNLFERPTVGAAFLQRMLEARRIISELALKNESAGLAIVHHDQPSTNTDFRRIGGSLTVGRAPSNDWVVADPQRRLSAKHFRITKHGAEYLLVDLNSTNGTWLNESTQRLASASLRHGDFIYAGGCEFLFILGSAERL